MGWFRRLVEGALEWLSGLLGDGPPPLFDGSMQQFLTDGPAILAAKPAEPYCAPTALAVIEALIEALPDLDLDASRLTVEDQSDWVTLRKGDPSWPTGLRFEVISSKPLSLHIEWYPPTFAVAHLDVAAKDPRERYNQSREILEIQGMMLDNDFDRLRRLIRSVVRAWPEEPGEGDAER